MVSRLPDSVTTGGKTDMRMEDDVRRLYIVRRLVRAGVAKGEIAKVIDRHGSAVTGRVRWWNRYFRERGVDVRL